MSSVFSNAFPARLRAAIIETATTARLDPSKFGDEHWEVVDRIVAFLRSSGFSADPPPPVDTPKPRFARLFSKPKPVTPRGELPVPIIICGEPGTGKTTFLSVIDIVLRTQFGLPDLIEPQMQKNDGRVHVVQKRALAGMQISLQSVRKWADMLHFYSWDVVRHRFDNRDLNRFIATTLRPMRIIFADEVEMTGFSPTIPDLARRGILVVGTSNQTRFRQLENELVAPHVISFGGEDMRSGNPADAVVTPDEAAWAYFGRLSAETTHPFEQLHYQTKDINNVVLTRVNFPEAVRAPLLESEWVGFFQATYKKAGHYYEPLRVDSAYVLLMERFDLDDLMQDFNTIIRFVSLFDAIEQLGLGVLVRHEQQTLQLTYASFEQLKTMIEQSPDVRADVKRKVLVGIGRLVSRLGQAGYRARRHIDKIA